MKVLLTGANGLIGQKLKKALASREDVELIATSLHEELCPLPLAYRFEMMDITDHLRTEALLERHRPGVVIHTAALANVNLCEKEQATCERINTEAVQNLTRLANRFETHLIHFSSDFVFDGQRDDYREEDPTRPLNHYGATKEAAEQYLMNHGHKWSIIRTILVYGYFPGMKRNNLATWVYYTLRQNKPIWVVGDQYRTPTLAEDVAEACAEMALRGKTGIYHLAGKELMSIRDMALRVAQHFGLDSTLVRPISSEELNEPAPRPPRSGFTLEKAEKMLHYQPRSLSEGLKVLDKQIHKLK